MFISSIIHTSRQKRAVSLNKGITNLPINSLTVWYSKKILNSVDIKTISKGTLVQLFMKYFHESRSRRSRCGTWDLLSIRVIKNTLKFFRRCPHHISYLPTFVKTCGGKCQVLFIYIIKMKYLIFVFVFMDKLKNNGID